MQVKISRVADAGDEGDAPEVRVGVATVNEKGVPVGAATQLSKEEPDATISIPVGGKVELTAEGPPVVYDVEQKASVPGKWPEKEKPKEEAAKAKEPTPKSEGESAPSSYGSSSSETSSRKK